MRLERRLAVGTKLFAVLRLSHPKARPASGPRIAVRGVVQRIEPQPDGRWGVGTQFTQHRFL
jgi:hypothetical protein